MKRAVTPVSNSRIWYSVGTLMYIYDTFIMVAPITTEKHCDVNI